MWPGLFEKIEHLNYVIQRNWVIDQEHPDLDLFVSSEDKWEMLEIVKQYDLVDVRFPGDGYYPDYVCYELLQGRRKQDGFYIPSKKAYFLALYYHNAVHKPDNPYAEELKRAFLDWLPAQRCEDEGVGYYV